jgi:hypothetical protein
MSARPGEHAPAARAAGRAASRPGPAPAQAARPWRDYWQLVPVALLMYALVAIDRFRRGAQAAGLVNAVTINRLSRPIGGRAALAMNHWLTGHPVPAAAAAAYYMVLQVLVTAAAGIWLFGSGHPSYRRHRDTLVVTGVIGLVAFWVHPVVPPRMLPGYHDTVEAIGPLFSHLLETKAADAFASFPSLHVTWALWVALVGQDLLRRRIWRAAVWAYPAATTIDVLATANHYVLDAIAAPAVLAAGYGTVVALPALARHAHLPRRARPPRPPAAGPPESCTPPLAVGSSPNRVARGCRDVLLRAAADARAERPWAVPGRPARPSLKPASAHPKTCPVSRTPQTAAGHAASARSPPGPGVTGPAAPHGCSSVPFPVNHECRGATVIAR